MMITILVWLGLLTVVVTTQRIAIKWLRGVYAEASRELTGLTNERDVRAADFDAFKREIAAGCNQVQRQANSLEARIYDLEPKAKSKLGSKFKLRPRKRKGKR